MRNLSNNKNGIILGVALLVILILIILSVAFVARAVHEKAMADREISGARALYTSEAGGQAGVGMLDTLINNYMLNTVNAANPSVVSSHAATYVGTNNPLGFLIAYVKNAGVAQLTLSGAEAVYTGSATALDGGSFTYTIRLSAKGNPSNVAANVWDFPYYYKIQTTGTKSNQSRKFTVLGDFTVRVQRDNFARYALFTNTQTMPSGSNVWFTNRTNFSGPLFTNGQFNFAYNPSGTFYDTVKQVNANGKFYNGGSPVNLNANVNGTLDVPSFQMGYNRSQTGIAMPNTTQESDMVAQATAGNTYGSAGIYVPTSGPAMAGGIYVNGDASMTMSVDGSDRAVYTITQGASTKTITVDAANNQTLVTTGATTDTYTGKPDGVDDVGTIIYVNGNLTSLGGAVQKDTQAVIATHNDVVIQNNIHYSQYTPSSGTVGQPGYVPPSAEGYGNLLGVMSWAGNIRIGTSAPNDVNVHATLMAQQGIVTVDNYNSGSPRGNATLLGGVISNNYGAFGTVSGGTGTPLTGYGRNFTYDTRMETQYTPPYFPTMNTFIAFTNDINDKKFWQTGGF